MTSLSAAIDHEFVAAAIEKFSRYVDWSITILTPFSAESTSIWS